MGITRDGSKKGNTRWGKGKWRLSVSVWRKEGRKSLLEKK